MDTEVIKEYTNGVVTIVWKPALCIHSTICWKGETALPAVFNPRNRPWINMEGSSSDLIVQQVKKCPSGALSFRMNDGDMKREQQAATTKIEVVRNGPLLVHGAVILKDQNGAGGEKQGTTAFCRCGLSSNKPFCDGSHTQNNIDD